MDKVLAAAQTIATARRGRAPLAALSADIVPADEAEGYRVQYLIDAAQRSHRDGRFVDVRPETMERA